MRLLTRILPFVFFIGLLSCESKSHKQEYAEMIIEKVEVFQNKNGRLPNEVSEIGLTESENSPAFYDKTSDSTYTVWYGMGLGESRTFNSQTQEWTEGG